MLVYTCFIYEHEFVGLPSCIPYTLGHPRILGVSA